MLRGRAMGAAKPRPAMARAMMAEAAWRAIQMEPAPPRGGLTGPSAVMAWMMNMRVT